MSTTNKRRRADEAMRKRRDALLDHIDTIEIIRGRRAIPDMRHYEKPKVKQI